VRGGDRTRVSPMSAGRVYPVSPVTSDDEMTRLVSGKTFNVK
jgi:hypothetical protein